MYDAVWGLTASVSQAFVCGRDVQFVKAMSCSHCCTRCAAFRSKQQQQNIKQNRNYRKSVTASHRVDSLCGVSCSVNHHAVLQFAWSQGGRPPRWPSGKASASRAEDTGIFSGSSHTSDLKTDTPVATLPGAWHYRVSAGTGCPVSVYCDWVRWKV